MLLRTLLFNSCCFCFFMMVMMIMMVVMMVMRHVLMVLLVVDVDALVSCLLFRQRVVVSCALSLLGFWHLNSMVQYLLKLFLFTGSWKVLLT